MPTPRQQPQQHRKKRLEARQGLLTGGPLPTRPKAQGRRRRPRGPPSRGRRTKDGTEARHRPERAGGHPPPPLPSGPSPSSAGPAALRLQGERPGDRDEPSGPLPSYGIRPGPGADATAATDRKSAPPGLSPLLPHASEMARRGGSCEQKEGPRPLGHAGRSPATTTALPEDVTRRRLRRAKTSCALYHSPIPGLWLSSVKRL